MKLNVKIAGIFAVVAFALTAVAADAAFTRDLTLGSTGADVTELQTVLEKGGYLTIPAGTSKGYFGALTKSAVMKWQAAVGLPATGYFGPMSRAKLADAGTTTGGSTTGSTSDLKGGDGDFKKFSILSTPNNEEVEEGDTTEVFGFEFEADDSDLRIERADFIVVGQDDTTKPWKVLEEIVLTQDGDEVASFDASDEDSWEEEDDDEYSFTFSGINAVVEEGDEAKFYVEVTAQDDLDTNEIGDEFSIAFLDSQAVRALNAEGINVYEGATTQRLFTVEEFEAGDLSISVDEDDNEDRTVEVDDDQDTDDEVVYIAKVESKDGDNTLEDITVTMTSPSSESLTDMIDSVRLFVDGEEVGNETASTSIVFDDIDFDLAEDEEVDVEVRVDLNDTNDQARYQDGDTFRVTGISVDYVDSNDDDQTEADQTDGGLMTVNTAGFEVTSPSVTATESFVADDSGESDVGTYKIVFTVTAGDEDVYVGGVFYDYSDDTKASDSSSFTGPSSKLQSSGNYKVSEGKSEKFTITVELTATSTVNTAQKVWLEGVQWNTTNSTTTYSTYESNLDDFETDEIFLRKI